MSDFSLLQVLSNSTPVTKYPDVEVPQYKPKKGYKRNYNKHHACYICDELKAGNKMGRHLELMHSDDPSVAKLFVKRRRKKH